MPPRAPSRCSGEYRGYRQTLERAIQEAYAAGYLGANACGTGMEFHVHTQPGAGAYVCGECMSSQPRVWRAGSRGALQASVASAARSCP